MVEDLLWNGSVLRRTSANMPRVRWLSVPVVCFILVHSLFGFVIVTADCWYDNEKHPEGTEVATAEPCLNCTCSRGVLLCYLRVCPKLPNPPPPGCILLHRYRACCPELICTDIPSGNGIESRSDMDGMDLGMEKFNFGNACMVNGSIYGPGSAMDSSTDCEYCYCLGGQQKCVRPKCLLPLDGCTPAYDSSDCCPVHYNCTKNLFTSTTTTTISPNEYEAKGGCIVDSNFYPEGGKVLGVGHSICDNCYCLRGLVRCEPLSCAPPLLGCTPVIRQGECCAASYNCSGMIEAQPEPYYGLLPIVSKEYAKLRKEVQHKRTTTSYSSEPSKRETGNVENIPYYVIAETSKPKLQPTTRQYTGFITQSPFYYNITNISPTTSMRRNDTLPEIYYVMTKVAGGNKNTDVMNYDVDSLATTVRHKKYTSSVLPPEVDTLESRINRRINQNDTDSTNMTEATISTTMEMSQATDFDFETSTFDDSSTIEITTLLDDETTTEDVSTTDVNISTEDHYRAVTVKSVSNSTDCSTVVNDGHTDEAATDATTVTEEEVTDETTEVVDNVDAETKVNVATVVPKNMDDSDDNVTKNKDDYDYDYNAPTLPPSLPNLRIIPFVAADALDSKKSPIKNTYSEDRGSEEFPFKNLFSPPVETEGGFVPKEPPLLDNFYENNYHTTNIGANAVTPLPGPAITNPPKTDENNCMVDGNEVTHGESVPSEGTCAICVCFYGSIVCHEPQCPIPRTGCRNSNQIDRSTCCPHLICDNCMVDGNEVTHGESVPSEGTCAICVCFYGSIVCHEPQCPIPRTGCRNSNQFDRSTCCPHLICDDEESPTVVLGRLDVTPKPQDSITVSASMMSQDPFRDVIRTEPAPDLKLLIGDMSNYLLKKTTTPATTTTQKGPEKTNKTAALTDDDVLTLDKIWQFLISDDLNTKSTTRAQSPTTTREPPVSSNHLNLEIRTANHNVMETRENINDNLVRQPNDHSGVGLLKLAGCNIYGRMYRVGRIISELSGPCMECKCTEMGVQCETLKC